MNKLFLTFTILATLLILSCKENTKQENNNLEQNKITSVDNDDIVNKSLTDKNANKLDMVFNNTKGIVIIYFNGKELELKEEKSASGIWYTNDHFDLSGKGNNIVLKKDGNIVFEHQDNILMIESKNEDGDKLNLTFNNSQGTVKIYLNGGKQIDLKEKKAASGIWYANEHYELSGKGNKYELKKDRKTVFKN